MSELLLNGAPVVSAVIEARRRGHWTADVVTDTADVPTGPVSITDASGTVLLRGRVLRGGAPFERAELSIVGGVGALGTILPPRYYFGAAVSTVLADVARETDSVIASDVDAAVIGRTLPAWVRIGGHEATAAILHLLRSALPSGWTWRTRYDGSLWLGAETWPDVIAPEVEVVDRRPATKSIHVRAATVAELLAIEPGMVFEGEPVGHVRIEARSDRLRAVIVTGDRGESADSLSDGIRKLAREATIERSLLALYEARVLAQAPTTARVDVEPQPDLPEAQRTIPTMTDVPLVAPYPGGKLFYPANAIKHREVRVLVGFIDGDPSKPYALPWPNVGGIAPERVSIRAPRYAGDRPGDAPSPPSRFDLEADTIALGGDTKGVARDGDSVGCGTLTATAPPGGGLVQFVYTPQGGAPLPPAPSVSITGAITSASSKVKTS